MDNTYQIVRYPHDVFKIAKIETDQMVIHSIQSGTDLLGDIYYNGFDIVILDENQICPSFFDLSTGMAGEILQKFANYKVKMIIIGDFDKYQSRSLQDFIYESNQGKVVNFVDSLTADFMKMT